MSFNENTIKIHLHYLLIVERQKAPMQLLLPPSFSLPGSFISRVLYPFESISIKPYTPVNGIKTYFSGTT